MYRWVVKHVLVSSFAGLNRGRINAITDRLSDAAEHYVFGQHALSGTRRTLATVEWVETNSGGERSENSGINVVELHWGKVRRVAIYTDTQQLVRTLDRLAAAGNAEAHAAPICDP